MKIISSIFNAIGYLLLGIGFLIVGPLIFWALMTLVAIVLGFLLGHYDPSADVGYP
jgi:hypothetical protein